MLGPLPVKVLEAHIPDLSVVNSKYWKYTFEKHELEGVGYVCRSCGYSRVIKCYIDNETGMVALRWCYGVIVRQPRRGTLLDPVGMEDSGSKLFCEHPHFGNALPTLPTSQRLSP